jgi:glyoxylase-like metal-dependent hydrolase (beta-lactamase superfamily II)
MASYLDHCGANMLFPHVPIYVQRREYAATQEPGYTVKAWIDFPKANYQMLDGDNEVLPGIELISTPGHTVGHQSVVLTTREGPIILAGQAICSSREYERIRTARSLLADDPPSDPGAYLASALRLIDLGPQYVFFSHDRSVWQPAP